VIPRKRDNRVHNLTILVAHVDTPANPLCTLGDTPLDSIEWHIDIDRLRKRLSSSYQVSVRANLVRVSHRSGIHGG
jgi:hypothetical protein